MKKILIIKSLVLLVLLSTSCKQFLDVQPQGKVLPKTDEEFAAIIHSCINNIEGGEDQYVIGNFESVILNESYADNLDANVKVGNLAAYVGDKINTQQLSYKNTFSIIRDCNIVIEHMAGRDSELANKLSSASYAIKGICYYNLMRDFCKAFDKSNANTMLGLPIIESFDMEEMPVRSTLEETYRYCEKLLQKSMSYNIDDKIFLFTKDVVKAYLARLYFLGEDWESVISISEELMAKPEYGLATISEYADMIQSKNSAKQEVIIRSHTNNNSDIDWYYVMIIKDIDTRPVSASLVNLFRDDLENDIRYSVSFDSKRVNNKTIAAKYRSSELVLMLAESYAHIGNDIKALENLNLLRRNRIDGAVDYTNETLPIVNENSLIKVDAEGKEITPLLSAIFNERQKEFYMEGDRWYELKRNGTPEFWVINNGLKYTTKEYLYTAPIYKSDLSMNEKLIQNEGYED